MAKEMKVKLIGYEVSGEAVLHLWGGDKGSIEMNASIIKEDKLSKDNILRCVNDNGFGCELIERATIHVIELYEHGAYGKTVTLEADRDEYRDLYLGWRFLQEHGILLK